MNPITYFDYRVTKIYRWRWVWASLRQWATAPLPRALDWIDWGWIGLKCCEAFSVTLFLAVAFCWWCFSQERIVIERAIATEQMRREQLLTLPKRLRVDPLPQRVRVDVGGVVVTGRRVP